MFSLIILGASITGLAVARDAHRHGLRPIVVDVGRGPAFDSRWVDAVQLKSIDDAAAVERIGALGRGAAALISTADHWTRWLQSHRASLQAHFGTILHPGHAALEVCLDKLAFARWCAAAALPTPRTWSPGDGTAPSLRFPVLLRPLNALADHRRSRIPKAVQARDKAELDQWLNRYAEQKVQPIVSESLLGRPLRQYSVPFARNGSKILLFTALKVRPFAELCQTGTYVQMCVDERAAKLARDVIERLDYFGIGEVEILRDLQTDTDYLIEINARPWLQYALAPASNHDFLGLVLGQSDGAAGRPVQRTWIDLGQDLFVAFSRSIGIVRRGELGIGAYLRSLTESDVFALFDWRDPYPFLASLRR